MTVTYCVHYISHVMQLCIMTGKVWFSYLFVCPYACLLRNVNHGKWFSVKVVKNFDNGTQRLFDLVVTRISVWFQKLKFEGFFIIAGPFLVYVHLPLNLFVRPLAQ